MKRIIINGKETVELNDTTENPIGSKDIAVQVKACGICGSDLNFYRIGGLTPEMEGVPLHIGHEFSGIVSDVGTEVRDIEVGDRVVVNPATGGNIGFGGTEGAFCSRVVVKNAAYGFNIFNLPKDIPFNLGALVEPLNVGKHAVDRSNPQAGEKILVIGAGPIGLAVLCNLAHRGFNNVIISDLSDYRLKAARQLGAGTTINAGTEDVWKRVQELHGESNFFGQKFPATDIIIEASGAPIIEQLISKAKFGARITFVASSHKPVSIHFGDIMTKQLDILGSFMYSEDFGAPIDLLASRDLSPMISHHFPLEQFGDALKTTLEGDQVAKVMIEL